MEAGLESAEIERTKITAATDELRQLPRTATPLPRYAALRCGQSVQPAQTMDTFVSLETLRVQESPGSVVGSVSVEELPDEQALQYAWATNTLARIQQRWDSGGDVATV